MQAHLEPRIEDMSYPLFLTHVTSPLVQGIRLVIVFQAGGFLVFHYGTDLPDPNMFSS